MRVKVEVQDHAHGGGQITVREMVVTVSDPAELLAAIWRAMGTYPICHAKPV